MEYLGGNSLKEYMVVKFDSDEKYYFDINWTIKTIILPVCNALALVHSSNIYHRDLKQILRTRLSKRSYWCKQVRLMK
jgi:serine/threonine protein kinase